MIEDWPRWSASHYCRWVRKGKSLALNHEAAKGHCVLTNSVDAPIWSVALLPSVLLCSLCSSATSSGDTGFLCLPKLGRTDVWDE